MDVGFTFQPIHAPLFRIFALRYLLPLRLGVSVQNMVAPYWNMSAETKPESDYMNYFPTTLRWGFSYRFIVKDWLPEAWGSISRFFGNFYLLAAFDQEIHIYKRDEKQRGFKTGNFFGLEGVIPLSENGFALFPRAGFNNRMEGTALGMGLSMPFSKSALVRIDYSYGFHQYLPEDNRFFLTIQTGRELNAEYFRSVSQLEEIEQKRMRKYLLRVLTEYPNDYIDEAVEDLVAMDDSLKNRRYYSLTGGLGRAGWLFREAKLFLKRGFIRRAQRKALQASQEYEPLYDQIDHPLDDLDLMNYSEALIISQRMDEAIPKLEEVQDSTLRTFYLEGICQKAVGNWDEAIRMFHEAVNRYDEEGDMHHMVGLSLFQLGEVLILKEEYEPAIQFLKTFINNYKNRLDPDYPRYPSYHDSYILDDAQFLIGISQMMMGQYKTGVTELMKTQRFYPDLEYGGVSEIQSDPLIQMLKTDDSEQLDLVARQLMASYRSAHQWSLED